LALRYSILNHLSLFQSSDETYKLRINWPNDLEGRNIWRQSYGSFARMKCPRCHNGALRMDTSSFAREEPPYNKFNDHEGGVFEAGRFKGFLRCNRPFCGEIVVLAGNYTTEYHDDYDHETETPVTHEVTSYRPFMMCPAPEIIQYPSRLNKDSKEHLSRSFALFWADYAACANRLRIVTEFLLDQLGIERKGKKGDERMHVSTFLTVSSC
ncbi:MAG: hypothetical protein VX601_10200, partial [Pseudomonadota bacterium]|nr:hypothetical protein [Pseudomonadota bacterium]